MTRLEFGLTEDPLQAMIRLPERSHPLYRSADGNPFEHLAHTRERLTELVGAWTLGSLSELSLDERSIPLNVSDMVLMSEAMSFKRDLTKPHTTIDWGYLDAEPINPWYYFYPTGDDNYLWWQITRMKPAFALSQFSLFSIETNGSFSIEENSFRFNSLSDFDLVMATSEEIEILTGSIIH
jgi:hypothetical protein